MKHCTVLLLLCLVTAGCHSGDDADKKLVVNVPAPGTIRLLPPLVVEADQIDQAVGLIGESLLGSGAHGQ